VTGKYGSEAVARLRNWVQVSPISCPTPPLLRNQQLHTPQNLLQAALSLAPEVAQPMAEVVHAEPDVSLAPPTDATLLRLFTALLRLQLQANRSIPCLGSRFEWERLGAEG
jgi:hypothetical protein